jgi:hypothetical protein
MIAWDEMGGAVRLCMHACISWRGLRSFRSVIVVQFSHGFITFDSKLYLQAACCVGILVVLWLRALQCHPRIGYLVGYVRGDHTCIRYALPFDRAL